MTEQKKMRIRHDGELSSRRRAWIRVRLSSEMSRVPALHVDGSRRGGRFLMEKWGQSSAGKSRATTRAYTAVLASRSRRGTRTLGEHWQLAELLAVSCYTGTTGQGFVRGSEENTVRCLGVVVMRER